MFSGSGAGVQCSVSGKAYGALVSTGGPVGAVAASAAPGRPAASATTPASAERRIFILLSRRAITLVTHSPPDRKRSHSSLRGEASPPKVERQPPPLRACA